MKRALPSHSEAPAARRFRRCPPPPPSAFGFNKDAHLAKIVAKSVVGKTVYELKNYIKGFDDMGQPIFTKNHRFWKVDEICGRELRLEGQTRRFEISTMHTDHTISIYKAAHAIRDELRSHPLACIGDEPSTRFKQVDIRHAKSLTRRANENKMWLNVRHLDDTVVLKTTTDPAMQLTYIIEAIIHEATWIRCPTYIPKLHFVAFAAENRLVVCSQQLKMPSVGSFLHALPREKINPDIATWFMVRSVCMAIRRLQISGHFTHRDCHIGNVYYDMRRRRVNFIDFDWSCVRWQDKNISVPRQLYDTTRQAHGYNKSVDCCVFFRTLGPALRKMPTFLKKIYDPLMQRYQEHSERFLRHRAGTEVAAMQLYKLCTEGRKINSSFGHHHGLRRCRDRFEYVMGYYTWECMTPESILTFLELHKFF